MSACLFNKVFQKFLCSFFCAVPLQESTCISTESATSVILPVRSAPVQRKRTALAALNAGENWITKGLYGDGIFFPLNHLQYCNKKNPIGCVLF